MAKEPPADPRSLLRPLPGLQADGAVLLPNQWSLRPTGKQVEVGCFPVNVALHPRGDWAAILHSGYGTHEVVVVDLKTASIVSRVTLPKTFYGLCFTPDGKRLLVSGGEDDVIYRFHFADGYLSGREDIELLENLSKKASKTPENENRTADVTTGLACSHDGRWLYAACCLGNRLVVLPLRHAEQQQSIAMPAESHPYTALPSAKSDRLYVSLWGKSSVAVIDRATEKIDANWPTASHPTEMVLSPHEDLLYVACADSNTVSVIDTQTGQQIEVITTSLYPQALHGSTPNSLALAPNGKTLWVANADANNLAVIDVSRRGQSRSLGFIPVGWYPTSVRMSARADRILVANGKGLSSKANRNGPNPLVMNPETTSEYIGGLFPGALSIIATPKPEKMPALSKAAYACSPLRADSAPTGHDREPDNPIPAKVGDASPIKHCIYVIKENRTYDQVFGDIREGNGEANLCIFPQRVTPNLHALARQFVLLDNFYVDGEVSANGHEWSTAAYATDYVEKVWPQTYRREGEHNKKGDNGFPYPGKGDMPIALPTSGYLWDRCRAAGVSYYDYGEFIDNGPLPDSPGSTQVKGLKGHFDPQYRSFDLDYSDQRRADRFLEELKRFEREGEMPRWIILYLPNDHTAGTKRDAPTPTAYVADNDLAVGRVVEAVSHGKFWKDTAIFMLEDDAQNGPDHVDAHRSTALVVSPYTKRRHVDSSMYSTSSMLRTMELILGLQPMTQFDAAAQPMYDSFQATADLTPFKHLPAGVSLDERNVAEAWGAGDSDKMDFREADAADDQQLNEIIWRSVRGADHPMPPPVRAAFFLPHDDRD
ncbi:MAG: bifunctional YncE family protein/alkaline phosphatase family protein [Thermoguttaceae bacterium]